MHAARLALFLCLLCLLPCLGYAEYDASKAWHAQYYNTVAYCDADMIREWNCGPACMMHPDFVVSKVHDNGDYGTQAFTGVNHETKQIVLSFRGSNNGENDLEDVFYFRSYYLSNTCDESCLVHTGFQDAYLSLQSPILDDIMTLVKENPGYTVLVTGHSLGGAMATFAAVDIAVKLKEVSGDVPLDLYTFGSPRVGNPAFVSMVTKVLPAGRHFRVVHNRDPVPHLPPELFGFIHVPSEVWYKTYSNTSYEQCVDSADAESRECSDSLWFPINIEDHLSYFGYHQDCVPTPVSSRREVRYLMAQHNAQMEGRTLSLSPLPAQGSFSLGGN